MADVSSFKSLHLAFLLLSVPSLPFASATVVLKHETGPANGKASEGTSIGQIIPWSR
jgi:hypothetical protein